MLRIPAEGRVDLFGYTTGGTASRCPNARLTTLLFKKGFAMHLPMRSGRRGRHPSRLTAQIKGASGEAPSMNKERSLRLAPAA